MPIPAVAEEEVKIFLRNRRWIRTPQLPSTTGVGKDGPSFTMINYKRLTGTHLTGKSGKHNPEERTGQQISRTIRRILPVRRHQSRKKRKKNP